MPPSLLRETASDGALGADASHADGTDLVSLYFREIHRIPRLTRDEEVALSIRAKAGDEAASLRLVEANLLLVVMIAKRYFGRGLPLLDLIQEGNLALLRVVKTFDAGVARFSTYASRQIQWAIVRALDNQAHIVRLPVHLSELWRSAGPVAGQLGQQFGRPATIEEVAGAMKLPVTQLWEVKLARLRPVSLDSPLDDDEDNGRRLSDVIADDRTPADDDEKPSAEDYVANLIESLDERQRTVIRLRFGFEGQGERQRPSPRGRDDGFTAQAVAARIGCSPTSVQRLEAQALATLRQRAIAMFKRGRNRVAANGHARLAS